MIILLYWINNATVIRLNINMKVAREKVTADKVLDLYAAAKKAKTVSKKEEIMKKVIYLSQHLNEFLSIREISR
jgi:hypothetical protein